MNRKIILNRIIDNGAVAVVRLRDPNKAMHVAEALYNGGVENLEITMTIPNALSIIKKVSEEMCDSVLVGVGSILDKETAEKAIEAGAKYIVSPIYDEEIISVGHKFDLPVMPGAFTPTEIQKAYKAGADIVKVFPADVLGMKFFSGVKAPMPHLRLMPTGGVTLTNADQWFDAGACAVGIGNALVDQEAITRNDFKVLTKNAKVLINNIQEYRSKKKL
jgi:2-dehydro-3-deoxyphosphogluconate aldolase / (4S)-4-hydroxy-2-oxoglutarate aldolase